MLTFPALDRPEVAIVMPLNGRWEWTVRALRALLANTEPIYEVIVVDNDSPDESADHLELVAENVQLLRNPANFGFGVACNQGAAAARSPFVVFLNSDALVQDDWLSPLLEQGRKPHVGAVGPRYLNLDDSTQEAGAVLFGDGFTAPYGTDAAGKPDIGRHRRVDYVSAACLLVGRTPFDAVGGFDAAYAPAYYEDVDLCLALAARGYRTVYEPRSRVTHAFGWGSSAPDGTLLERNRCALGDRWRTTLTARPASATASVRARDAPLVDRLLIIGGAEPSDQKRAARFALSAARLCPDALVAVADPVPEAEEPLLAGGVAIVRGGDWPAMYRFHFDVVFHTGRPDRTLADRVRRYEPQADWVVLPDRERDGLADLLGALGVDVEPSAGDVVDDV